MQAICPFGYYQNGVVTTETDGHMMFVYTLMLPVNQNCIFGALIPAICNFI